MSRAAPLPDLLSGERREIKDSRAGPISYYVDGPLPVSPSSEPPLLLVHSINAAASAHEVKPLFDVFKKRRLTYALDLPGYGHSDRSDRAYEQRLMIDAIHAVTAEMRAESGATNADALAVSLSCEFLARAALESPEAIRSLALVSATGFSRNTATPGPPEANRGRTGVYRVLSAPVLGRCLFRLLTTAPSIRFFLRKTWGRKDIDEEMFRNSCLVSRAPGARHAPFHFLSGFLFSADIPSVYRALRQPVWLSHGVRGDFTDFSRAKAFREHPNWRVTPFQTGALPYFEVPADFLHEYDDFLDKVTAGVSVNPGDTAHDRTT